MLIYVLNSKISQRCYPKLYQNVIFIEYSLKINLDKEIFKSSTHKASKLKNNYLINLLGE